MNSKSLCVKKFGLQGNKQKLFFLLFLSTVLYSTNVFSISAFTAKTIKGTMPELSADLQKELTDNRLSLINLVAVGTDGVSKYSYNYTNFINKLESIPDLRNVSLDNITAKLANDSSGTLTGDFQQIQQGDAFDGDGDNNFYLTGDMIVGWYFDNLKGKSYEVAYPEDLVCKLVEQKQAPYIRISAFNLKLFTQYGDPSYRNYGNTIKKFNLPPTACYARPNIQFGVDSYAGPKTIWDTTFGFIPQDISTPSRNFPTTGVDELYFYLSFFGTTKKDVIETTIAAGENSHDVISLDFTDDSYSSSHPNLLRIKLKGPNESNPKSFSATEFKIKATSDFGDVVDLYTFKLSKWFIAKEGIIPYSSDNFNASSGLAVANEAIKYCEGLGNGGYVIPTLADYVTRPINGGNQYARGINGSLLSEWGNFKYYNINFGFYLWVSDSYYQNQVLVYVETGETMPTPPANQAPLACVHYGSIAGL